MNSYLSQYIAQKNFWRDLRKVPLIDPYNISISEAHDLLQSIECDLSPENLCCDGELRGEALRRKTKMLHEAKKALENYA